MNEIDKRVELAQQLVEATREGRLAWHPTARVNEFICSLEGKYSVLVGKDTQGARVLRMLDEDERELLRMSEDEPFEPYPEAVRRGSPDVAKLTKYRLAELFDLARSNALHVDKAIEEALQGLMKRN
jgi:hypothetical protein